jgi:alkylation response protein AidB-like acyl-CoA dehydrogenase
MENVYHPFITTESQRNLYELAKNHAESFKENSARHDKEGSFPFENFEALKESGYTALTAPKEFGGQEISLYDFVLLQETLAQGDGPTALGIGWHLGIIMDLNLRREWKEDVFEKLCREVVVHKKLINRAATEPKTGSPTRGGMPQTTAENKGNGWVINGHKTFTTLSPVVDYLIINASVSKEEIGGFLIERNTPGVSFKDTWNTLGMRATRSDDVYLNEVAVKEEDHVEEIGWKDPKHTPPGWLLHIPACYLGIALAARKEVRDYAETYQPNSLPHPIIEVSHVQQKLGEIEIELMKARYLMYGVARQWDEQPDHRAEMGPDLAAVKYVATNAAVKAVDLTMRIVGGTSIFKDKPFERYYRDVLAGIYNPPSDDSVIQMLAKRPQI